VVGVDGLKEWAKYSAYGIPFGMPAGDTDSDGDCDSADESEINSWRTANPFVYRVRGDIDLDGDIDTGDMNLVQNVFLGINLGRGVLSSALVANNRGIAGYTLDSRTSAYDVRNRVFHPELGRWLRRDPLVYVDGLNLYGYLSGGPIGGTDPMGLRQGLLGAQLEMSIDPNERPRTAIEESFGKGPIEDAFDRLGRERQDAQRQGGIVSRFERYVEVDSDFAGSGFSYIGPRWEWWKPKFRVEFSVGLIGKDWQEMACGDFEGIGLKLSISL